VKRTFGTDPGLDPEWTLVGTDSANNDNYLGLDRFGRIDDLDVWWDEDQTRFNRYQYSYNYNSQVTLREDLVSPGADFDETYDYDNLGRLTDHKRGAYSGGSMSPIRLHECYTLDRSANCASYYNGTSSGCTPATCTAGFNASNEMTTFCGTGVGYNDAGDLTSRSNYDYEYDAWNRLMTVKDNTVAIASYKYNGLHQRIGQFTATPQLYYYYGVEGQVLEERDSSTVLNAYVWGTQYIDDLVVWYKGTTLNYMVWDANFNVVTRFTGTGGAWQVTDRTVYEGYGNPKLMNSSGCAHVLRHSKCCHAARLALQMSYSMVLLSSLERAAIV
jgi:YD repeat-containing protein